MLLIVTVTTAIQVLRLYRRRIKTGQETMGYSVLDGESRRIMLSLYQRMVRLLTKKGLPNRQPYQPPYEYAAIVVPQIPDGREAIYWLTQAINRAAYDPRPFDPANIREARQRLSALKRAINERH
jgi:lysyl-tRNA synthetase class I